MAEKKLSFDGVYAEHRDLVRRALTRRGVHLADLDDVAQETFVTVHRLLPTFEHRASLETWLYAVSWRVASGYHRKRRAQRQVVDEAEAASLELWADELPGVEHLHESLKRVAPAERELYALHEIGDLSIAELSELTGSSRATISERLDRTRRALGRILTAPPPPPSPTTDARSDGEEHVDRSSRREPLTACEHPAYISFAVGDTVIAYWRGEATEAAVQQTLGVLLTAAYASQNGITFLTVLEPTSRPPSWKGREMMLDAARQLRGRLRAGAWVIGGAQGFGHLVAPIINSAIFLTRTPFNVRFFRDLPRAIAWLAPYTEGRTPGDLLDCTAGMKARLDQLGKP